MLCNTQPLSKSPRPLSALLVGIPQGWGASCWGPTAPVPPQFNQQTSLGCTGKRKGGEEEETEEKKGETPPPLRGKGWGRVPAPLCHPPAPHYLRSGGIVPDLSGEDRVSRSLGAHQRGDKTKKELKIKKKK